MGALPSWLRIGSEETINAQVTCIAKNGEDCMFELKGPNGEGPVLFEWKNQQLSHDELGALEN